MNWTRKGWWFEKAWVLNFMSRTSRSSAQIESKPSQSEKFFEEIWKKYEEKWKNMGKIWCGNYAGACEKFEEIWRNMTEHLENNYEGIWRNIMWKIWRNMRKIWRKIPYYIDAGTWKNSEPSLLYGLWDLEEKYFELSPKIGSGPLHSFWDVEKLRSTGSET